MVAFCLDLMVGVFSRYVLFSTFTWYDEIARICFVWLVFLGAAVGVKRQAHFRLHLVVDALWPRARRGGGLFGRLVVIGFAAAPVQQGWAFVRLGRFRQTPGMGLPKSWGYLALPGGGAPSI